MLAAEVIAESLQLAWMWRGKCAKPKSCYGRPGKARILWSEITGDWDTKEGSPAEYRKAQGEDSQGHHPLGLFFCLPLAETIYVRTAKSNTVTIFFYPAGPKEITLKLLWGFCAPSSPSRKALWDLVFSSKRSALASGSLQASLNSVLYLLCIEVDDLTYPGLNTAVFSPPLSSDRGLKNSSK